MLPERIKYCTNEELDQLCEELRTIIYDTVMQCGGHLASNLGAVESVVALFIGCALANLASPMLYDLVFGSLTTLVAGLCTFFVGKLLKTDKAKIAIGGIFPVLLNAIVIPFMLVFFYDGGVGANGFFVAYTPYFLSILLTQAVWVYALGTPMYFSVKRLQNRGVKFFT